MSTNASEFGYGPGVNACVLSGRAYSQFYNALSTCLSRHATPLLRHTPH